MLPSSSGMARAWRCRFPHFKKGSALSPRVATVLCWGENQCLRCMPSNRWQLSPWLCICLCGVGRQWGCRKSVRSQRVCLGPLKLGSLGLLKCGTGADFPIAGTPVPVYPHSACQCCRSREALCVTVLFSPLCFSQQC